MSGNWLAHKAMLDEMLAAQKAKRAAKLAELQAAKAVAPVSSLPPVEAGPQPDMWQGGLNGGQVGMPGGIDYGGQPGDMSALGGKMGGFGPLAGGLLGGLAGTALAGPFGGALGAWGGRALAGLIGGPAQTGVAQPTEPGSVGGDFGPGGSGPNAFGGGLGDLGAAGMGLGAGGLGAMSGNEIMGFQSGGYTGAGDDGIVQPSRPAGVVHEGEYVIPAHMLRRLGMLAR